MKASDRKRYLKSKGVKKFVTPSGLRVLDGVLLGGFQKDSIIHFYGDPGSGKTTFAMQVTANIIKQGFRVIWVDCNGAFSLNRFKSLIDRTYLDNFTLVKTTSFRQQTQVIQVLQFHLEKVGLVVVDSITHHYRAERFAEGSQGFFQELIEKQLGALTGISHLQKIPIIIVNYSTINNDGQTVPLVSKGFQRVEKYRLYFRNVKSMNEDEENLTKELKIELSPEKYTQNRLFTFEIERNGIKNLTLKEPEGIKQ